WMSLAEMGPSTSMHFSSDLGLQNINRDYDWVGDSQRRYPNLENIDNFINEAC
ncbi:398_t:CDS:1, partial [Cetraspora pellucida]